MKSNKSRTNNGTDKRNQGKVTTIFTGYKNKPASKDIKPHKVVNFKSFRISFHRLSQLPVKIELVSHKIEKCNLIMKS